MTAPEELLGTLPYDLQDSLIDVPEAARLADVSQQVVRNWISRGYRDPRSGDWVYLWAVKYDGRTSVRPIDALRAEAATRERARR